jgi:hypothetical protein
MNGTLRRYAAKAPTAIDVDSLLLCTKPSQKAMQYIKIKALGNHFRVEDETFSQM